jgi:N-acetylglucosamine-6-phosphate deacetylase
VLSEDRISAEVIADGHHVHPACIRLLARAKPADRLLLITDAIAASGLGDGEYELGGLAIVVSDGVCRLKFGDSLAGSTLTMIDAFRYVVRNVGVSVEQASRMASGNPAELLGIADATGSLAVGKQADALLLSPDLDLKRVWALGNPIYTAS